MAPTERTEHTEPSGREAPPTERTEHTEPSGREVAPTDAHRLGGYGILPYPRCLRNPVVLARLYRLSEQELHQQNKQGYRPQNAQNTQNLLAEKYLPQIGTDAHRLGGYGILPYPRCLRNPVVSARRCRLPEQELHQQNKQGYRPQNAQNTQNILAEKHLTQIGTDLHRCKRVWHPAIPTQPQESSCLSSALPPVRARTAPTKQARISPTERTEHTEHSGREAPPTEHSLSL